MTAPPTDPPIIWVLDRDLEDEGEDEGVGVGVGDEVGKELRVSEAAVARDEDRDVVKEVDCEDDIVVVEELVCEDDVLEDGVLEADVLVVRDCEVELAEALEVVVVELPEELEVVADPVADDDA